MRQSCIFPSFRGHVCDYFQFWALPSTPRGYSSILQPILSTINRRRSLFPYKERVLWRHRGQRPCEAAVHKSEHALLQSREDGPLEHGADRQSCHFSPGQNKHVQQYGVSLKKAACITYGCWSVVATFIYISCAVLLFLEFSQAEEKRRRGAEVDS